MTSDSSSTNEGGMSMDEMRFRAAIGYVRIDIPEYKPEHDALDAVWKRYYELKVMEGKQPDEPVAITPAAALDAIKAAMLKDPAFAWTWHCGLAMSIMDNLGANHGDANRAAAAFMRLAFEVDTSQQPETKAAVQSADDLNLEPIGSCNRCGRKYWKRETTGAIDSMVQPNGGICGGRFELNGSEKC